MTLLPYQQATSNRISRLLAKHNMKTVHMPARNTINTLRSVKDNLGLRTPGVYCIPCECGKVHIGQTDRNIGIRCEEHVRHLCLGQPERSAVAEHVLDTGHTMEFNNTHRLVKTKGYIDRLVKEAIEIKLHPNNISRDSGFMLSQVWRPLLQQIETHPTRSNDR
jgi:hypothetical protein